ncbi:MAG: hypothetical protein WDN31_16180 [Hyphomicrobium sp.]
MLVDVIAVHVMQMPAMQIVDVLAVTHRGVASSPGRACAYDWNDAVSSTSTWAPPSRCESRTTTPESYGRRAALAS